MQTKMNIINVERDLINIYQGGKLAIKSTTNLCFCAGVISANLIKNIGLLLFSGASLKRQIAPGVSKPIETSYISGAYGHYTHPPNKTLW